MSGSTVTAALLQSQVAAASAAYTAAGSLAEATPTELGGLLTLYQTAYSTAQALQTIIAASFDANCGDALFASGVEPNGMAESLLLLQTISAAMVNVNSTVNILGRMVATIQLALQGNAQ